MRQASFSDHMDCADFRHMVDEFIDGELDELAHSEMERHSRECVACNEMEDRRRGTRQRLRATADSFRAPTDFMQRLQASLEEAKEQPLPVSDDSVVNALDDARTEQVLTVGEPAPAVEAAHEPFVRRFVQTKHWLAAAAVFALGAGFVTIVSQNSAEQSDSVVAGVASFASPVVAEAVAWHRRNVPVEVVGPDPLVVRQWFSDKVSFAVSSPDFGRSVRLLGGRLSHVRQYEAAYLMYEANGGKLSVMLFDAGELGTGLDLQHQTFVDNSNGYNVAIREKDGVTYTFTSDLDAEELVSLVDRAM